MGNSNGLILWLLLGTGVLLLYCAITNQTPQSLLATYTTGKSTPVPLSTWGGTGVTSAPTPVTPETTKKPTYNGKGVRI